MKSKNESSKNRLGDNPSLLQCLLEDASANLANGLGDAIGYLVDFVETLEKVKNHLEKKDKRRAGKM